MSLTEGYGDVVSICYARTRITDGGNVLLREVIRAYDPYRYLIHFGEE